MIAQRFGISDYQPTMCGRYTLKTTEEQLADEFELIVGETPRPRYNIAPSQSAPIIRITENNTRELALLRWGLIPHWAKDPKIAYKMINARSEEAANKPAYRTPMRRRRCLVPASGFYEWKKVEGGTKSRPKKQPYYITRTDGGLLALAGLWDRWQADDGETIETYTILTTSPNELMQPLHDRMPVILAMNDYARWLDPGNQDAATLQPLLRPFAGKTLTAHPVSARVNSPTFDDSECIERTAG